MSARVSRKGFLALSAAAAAGTAAGCGGGDEEQRAREARTAADLAIVQFLLRVERVSTAFWDEVVSRDALSRSQGAALAADVARNDRTHLEALLRYERRLGRQASVPPVTSFNDILIAGAREVLRSGAELANVAAAAYVGQLNRVQDRNLLASMLAVHSVEARQAAALNRAARIDGGIFPDGAFAQPLTTPEVEQRLKRFAP